MDRARHARITALIFAMVVTLALAPAGIGWRTSTVRAAEVGWPVSSLLVSELETGGASASDEFVEIANQGAGPVDLSGLEVVYSTSSGSTVTRKATWSAPTVLEPGRRILIANAAGVFAAGADLTYAGGFAATGGALALRAVGGAGIDAIGWGDALNQFVEGSAAPAPSAGSSLERLPGGAAGNAVDTNANLADWLIQPAPTPQSHSAPPVPSGPVPTPSTGPTPTPTPSPTPTPTPSPTPTPTAAPTAASSPSPSATPTPTAAPIDTPIVAARQLVDGTPVTVGGVLTTALGALEAGRSGFIQDASGGIGLYLDAPVTTALAAGTTVRVAGALGTRYHQRVLRIAEADLRLGASVELPTPASMTTGGLGEPFEGARVTASGTVLGAGDALSDGLGIDINDGTGAVRAVVGPDALEGRVLGSGDVVTLTGPLGQRDTGATGAAGYRIQATLGGELIVSTPIPTPTATPTPTQTATSTAAPIPTPTPTPVPTPVPSATAVPTPQPSPGVVTPASARALPLGDWVAVRATVTAEAGRLGSPRLFAIGDETGGVVVRLPLGEAGPARGSSVVVFGRLAAPYGQLELRPTSGGIRSDGVGRLPEPVALGQSGPTESSEGRLVSISGRLLARPSRSAGGDLTFRFERPDGSRFTVQADASSGIAATLLQPRATYLVTGIGGQRATRTGVPDGYRIWMRDRMDVRLQVATPPPSPSDSAAPSPSTSPLVAIPIAQALRRTDGRVVIVATVTAGVNLLDASGRRIVVQDATGALEVLLPAGSSRPAPGARFRLEGKMGVAYGSPRLHATSVDRLATGTAITPLRLFAPPTPVHVWRLVTVTGRIDDVHKLGDRWRAELIVGSARVPIVGQPGAGIPVSLVVGGRTASVTGIVRAAYPSASDRRATILPRSPSDVRVDPGTGGTAGGAAATPGPATTGGTGSGRTTGGDPSPGDEAATRAIPDLDLDRLSGAEGRLVRVGGLVVDLGSDRFRIDDGTAVGTIVLTGPALELLALIEPGDAVNLDGTVVRTGDGWAVTTADPAALARIGDPVVSDAGTATSDTPSSPSARTGAAFSLAGLELPGTGAAELAGVGSLVLLTLSSLVATLLVRRRRARQTVLDRVSSRLASIAAMGPVARAQGASTAPSVADRDPRSPDSA